MSQGITVEAIRLALSMNETRAKVASQNIAHANTPGAKPMRVDLAGLQPALDAAAHGAGSFAALESAIDRLASSTSTVDAPIELDAEVAEMVASSTNYQALTEALGRHFSLMRLATSGKS
jgi:flagellar basal body rod protein FlgB